MRTNINEDIGANNIINAIYATNKYTLQINGL